MFWGRTWNFSDKIRGGPFDGPSAWNESGVLEVGLRLTSSAQKTSDWSICHSSVMPGWQLHKMRARSSNPP